MSVSAFDPRIITPHHIAQHEQSWKLPSPAFHITLKCYLILCLLSWSTNYFHAMTHAACCCGMSWMHQQEPKQYDGAGQPYMSYMQKWHAQECSCTRMIHPAQKWLQVDSKCIVCGGSEIASCSRNSWVEHWRFWRLKYKKRHTLGGFCTLSLSQDMMQ